ncbi:MAG: PAS domain-containing protein [Salinivirgaceae bacterium]|nr:PAS domain-containing protein [Salinivirgaceae bacterium]
MEIGIGKDIYSGEFIESLSQEYKLLIQALNGLDSVIYINNIFKDGSIKLIWANNNLNDITGFTFEERQQMGEKYYELYYHPDDYKNVINIIHDVAHRKLDAYSMNYRIKHKNGKWVWIYSKGNIYDEDKDKGIRKCISVAINMTDRIVMNEEQLNILLKELAQLRNKLLINKLSNTELKIVNLLCKGLTVKQIAKKQNRSPETINNHKRNVFKKLGINKISELVAFAIENGLD